MDIVYKLTDANGCTRGNTKWGLGITHRGTGKGELCGPGFIHAYTHPLLAVLLKPLHVPTYSRLWECETEIVKTDRGLKVGGISLTTLREIPLPEITTQQRVLFAMLCLRGLLSSEEYSENVSRAIILVRTKNYAAAAVAAAAAAVAAYAAARAADADAAAAAAAADAARAANFAAAADAAAAAAAVAAYAAADAAYAAADAAYAARAADARTADFDLIAIAKEACS